MDLKKTHLISVKIHNQFFKETTDHIKNSLKQKLWSFKNKNKKVLTVFSYKAVLTLEIGGKHFACVGLY